MILDQLEINADTALCSCWRGSFVLDHVWRGGCLLLRCMPASVFLDREVIKELVGPQGRPRSRTRVHGWAATQAPGTTTACGLISRVPHDDTQRAGRHDDRLEAGRPGRKLYAKPGADRANAAAMKCLYLTTRSLDPSGTGGARWVARWKPGSGRVRDHTFESRVPPDEHNPTRPDQPSSNRRR